MTHNLFDPSGDFRHIADRTETVTLSRPGSSLSATVGGVVRQPYRKTELSSSLGSTGKHDWTWLLPHDETPFEPATGDRLVDAADERWTVLAVRQSSNGGPWRLVARNLVLAFNLNVTVEILRARYEKGEYGADVAVWETWRSGIAARIEPMAVQTKIKTSRIGRRHTFRIDLEDWYPLDDTYRIKTAEGTRYEIDSCRREPGIGSTTRVEAWKFE